MSKMTSGLSVAIPYVSIGTSATNAPLAIDGFNTVWTQGTKGMLKFDSTGNLLASDIGYTGPTSNPASPYGYGSQQSLVFDSNGTSLWTSDAANADLIQVNPTTDKGRFRLFQWQ